MMVTGLILDLVSRGRAEQKRIFYLSMPARQARSVVARELPADSAPELLGAAARAA